MFPSTKVLRWIGCLNDGLAEGERRRLAKVSPPMLLIQERSYQRHWMQGFINSLDFLVVRCLGGQASGSRGLGV